MRKAEPKTVIVAVRLSEREARWVDSQRGTLTRSAWLRWVLLRHRKSA